MRPETVIASPEQRRVDTTRVGRRAWWAGLAVALIALGIAAYLGRPRWVVVDRGDFHGLCSTTSDPTASRGGEYFDHSGRATRIRWSTEQETNLTFAVVSRAHVGELSEWPNVSAVTVAEARAIVVPKQERGLLMLPPLTPGEYWIRYHYAVAKCGGWQYAVEERRGWLPWPA
jgi:hypothetical protein